ncbi:MAG: hypothetical protein FWE29_05505 [Defluviitaleaceae bacterium]|nr:hypothetical protein [Defluviitaleaceae bacterium]
MKKYYIFILTAIILAVFATGCGASEAAVVDPSTYEKIITKLSEMETYRSEASVQYISNKNSNTYRVIQYNKMSGEYRIEVISPEQSAGNVTVFDGTTISQFNKRNEGRIFVLAREDMARSEILVTSFIRNYLDSTETSVSVGSFDNGKCTVLEVSLPGEHPYLATAKLWVDNKDLVPVKLVIYDSEGGERIVVIYENFEYNVELANDIFHVETNEEV